jgi:DNA-binding XRE family transcriptional regulator
LKNILKKSLCQGKNKIVLDKYFCLCVEFDIMSYEKEREQIIQHFKHIRRKMGWSQADMALYLEIRRTAYTRYETGVNIAPADKYVRIDNLLKKGVNSD